MRLVSPLSISRATSIFSITLGLLVLSGWTFNINVLKSLLPGLITMKPNTAIGFILSGYSLGALRTRSDGVAWRSTSSGAAGLVLLLGIVTLGQYVLDGNLGIDAFLFEVPPGASFSDTFPARMTPQAGLIFSIFGGSILLLRRRQTQVIAQYSVLASSIIPLLTMVGYLFGMHSVPFFPAYKPMAVHTALGFIALSTGFLSATSEIGFMARLRQKLLVFAFGLAVILLILSAIASITGTRLMAEASARRTRLYEILWQLEKVAAEVEFNIAANRGFALTGQRKFIAPLESSQARLNDHFSKIRQLIGDPVPMKKLTALQSLVAARIRLGSDIIALGHEQGNEDAANVLVLGEGERLNQQIRTVMDDFVQSEKIILANSEAQTQASENSALVALWSTLLTGLILMLSVLAALRQQIIERKRVEQERDRLAAVLEAATDYVCMSDLEAHISYINRAGRTILGIRDNTTLDLDIPDIHPRWAAELILKQGIPATKQRGTWQGETALLSPGGEEIPVSQVIQAHYDERGRISFLSTIMRNISDLKKAQKALAESENRYRLLIEYAPEAITVLDVDTGYFVDANANALNLFGLSRREFLRRDPLTMSPFIQPDGRPSKECALEKIQEALHGGAPSFEWIHLNAEGREIFCEVRLLRMHAGGRNLIRGSITDIGERKNAEKALRIRDNALRTSLNAITMADMDGNLTYVNDAFLALWKYDQAAEVLGKPFISLWRNVDQAQEVIATLSTSRPSWRGAMAGLKKDGELFEADLSASLAFGDNGEPIALMASFLDITESKRIQSELQLIKTTLDLTHDCVFMFDPETMKFFYVNKGAVDHVGYSVEEMLQMTPLDIKPQFDLPAYRAILEPMLSGATPAIYFETLHRHKDGHDIDVEIALQYVSPPNEQARFIAIVRDITQRKVAERKLKEQEAFYRGVIEASADCFWLFDNEGHILQASDNYIERSGYNHEELLGMRIRDVEAQLNAEQISERIQQIMIAKHALFESRHRAKNGTIWPVEVSTVFLPIAGGRFFSFIRDITERKRVENQLRASEASLKEAQRLARLGNWALDLTNNELSWSEEVFRIFEIDPSEFGASYQAFLDTVHPEDRSLINTAYLDSVANHSSYDIVHRLLMADGRIKYVHERGETVYEQGRPVRSIGTVQDVTQAKLADEELRLYRNHLESMVQQRTTELEAVNQELEAFAYSVSHDLRAPLRALDGFSQALLEDYGDRLDRTGVNYLNRVRAASQRMGNLIDDLLKLSRITRAPLKRSRIDLSELARTVVRQLREAAPEQQVEIKLEPNLRVTGDAGLLKIALENLLGNAWKYSAKQANPCIEFGSRVQEGKTVYYISDNGVGFDMQYADKLFGAFQRLHHRDQFEGNGIGLATVNRIIRRHGGRIWAESEPNKKTTFYFTLANDENELMYGNGHTQIGKDA